MLWLIGDAYAIRLRPIQLTDTTLLLRLGLRPTIDVQVDEPRRFETELRKPIALGHWKGEP
jgi:hypothetical protein